MKIAYFYFLFRVVLKDFKYSSHHTHTLHNGSWTNSTYAKLKSEFEMTEVLDLKKLLFTMETQAK